MMTDTEERFDDPVDTATKDAVIDYCNAHDIDLDDFCRQALNALKELSEAD